MSVGHNRRRPGKGSVQDMGIARRRAFNSAQDDWSGVSLGFEQFSEYLDRLGYVHELPAYVSAIYLCAGCVAGLSAAQKALEKRFFPALRACVGQLIRERDLVEDTLQEVRHRLLAGDSKKIVTYRGRGPLSSWLRTMAVNVALDQRRADTARYRRQRIHGDMLRRGMHGDTNTNSPDERILHQSSALLCERALRSSVDRLSAEERRLLYSYFVSGLSIDVLGKIHDVDRSTIARRIRRNLARIRSDLRAELFSDVQTGSKLEMASMAGLLFRYIDLSAAALLLPRGDPESHSLT